MPNIKSAIKRVEVTKVRDARNQVFRTSLKSAIKKVELAIINGDKVLADSEYRIAASKIDKAVSRGIMHINKAAHRKSALSLKLAEMSHD